MRGPRVGEPDIRRRRAGGREGRMVEFDICVPSRYPIARSKSVHSTGHHTHHQSVPSRTLGEKYPPHCIPATCALPRSKRPSAQTRGAGVVTMLAKDSTWAHGADTSGECRHPDSSQPIGIRHNHRRCRAPFLFTGGGALRGGRSSAPAGTAAEAGTLRGSAGVTCDRMYTRI